MPLALDSRHLAIHSSRQCTDSASALHFSLTILTTADEGLQKVPHSRQMTRSVAAKQKFKVQPLAVQQPDTPLEYHKSPAAAAKTAQSASTAALRTSPESPSVQDTVLQASPEASSDDSVLLSQVPCFTISALAPTKLCCPANMHMRSAVHMPHHVPLATFASGNVIASVIAHSCSVSYQTLCQTQSAPCHPCNSCEKPF